MSVGEVLREKMTNMQRWLESEGLNTDVKIEALPTVQLVAAAQAISVEAVRHRSFEMLLAQEDAPKEVDFVSTRPLLHDKFWRYLELFSELVA